MNSIVGRFQLEEVDEKQYLFYHLDSPGEQSMVPPLFLCYLSRLKSVIQRYMDLSEEERESMKVVEVDSSPYFNNGQVIQENKSNSDERLDLENHHYVIPLFWCKNKHDYNEDDHDDDDDDDNSKCKVCYRNLKIGTDYCFCVKCDNIYHKECIESPAKINHPHHPDHPLKLFIFENGGRCDHCGTKKEKSLVYQCTLCNVSMDNICAMKPILFVIEKTKRHEHPLTFFTRKDHLRCNICGLVNNIHHTYVCLRCNFVVHQDCANFPSVIRISRHHHRISFTSSLPHGKWSCGVCRKDVDSEYGAYTCNKCDGYVVHSRCALRKDIYDGKELEGLVEDDDIEEIIEPFKTLSNGVILHFLHTHALKPEISGEVYEENKICHACIMPIYQGKFYSCMECDFILHDKCANVPRKIRHPLHPNLLTLKISSDYEDVGHFRCTGCYKDCSGFIYECNTKENCFRLDVRCGSISEPFDYQGHEHPLFLALDPQEKHLCKFCQADHRILINCIECDFIICLRCVNLPYMAKYKHDKHFLTLVPEKETKEQDWCEICERILISSEEERKDEKYKRFYECKQCCITLHVDCLLGKTPYIKPGHTLYKTVQVVANTSLSRPFCYYCGNRCGDKTFFKRDNRTLCSLYPCT